MKFKGEDMLSEKSKYLQNVGAFILTVKISHKIITIFNALWTMYIFGMLFKLSNLFLCRYLLFLMFS